MMHDVLEIVKPPRAVFLNFPDGHTLGKPFDISLQMAIFKKALKALVDLKQPGQIIDLPYRWDCDNKWITNHPLSHRSCLDPGQSVWWTNVLVDKGDGRIHRQRVNYPIPGFENYPD